MTQPNITFNFFVYPDLMIRAGGWLPDDKRAHACWYFYTIAQTAKELIGNKLEDQMIYDDNLWMDKRYEQQARAVAALYGLDSPDEFAKFWEPVKQQARQLELPEPAEEYVRLIRRNIII